MAKKSKESTKSSKKEPIVEQSETSENKSSTETASQDTTAASGTKPVKRIADLPVFRIITGSYEHQLLCLSLTLYNDGPVFTPVFHFTPHTQSIRCLAQSKRYLVSGSNDEHIRIYDLQKRKELGTLMKHEGNVTALEFFDSKWLLSAGDDGKIFIWRTSDWEVFGELKGHRAGGINDLAIHPSGKIAISAGNDRTLRLWNLMTCRKASVLKVGRNTPRKVRWTSIDSDDAAHFVVGFDKRIQIYSSQSAKVVGRLFNFNSTLQHMEVYTLDGVEYVVTSHDDGSVIFIPLSEFLVESENGEEENEVQDISIDSLPASSFKLQGHGNRVKHFNFFFHEPTQTHFLSTVSSNGQLVIWNLEKSVRDQVAVYATGNRLNCCIIVSDDIEQFETMKKRRRINDDGEFLSDAENTDFSEAESEFELNEEEIDKLKTQKLEKKQKKASKRKSKKPKVIVEFE